MASLVAALLLLAGCSDLKQDNSSNLHYPDVEPFDAVEAGTDDPEGGSDVASDSDASTADRSLDGSLSDGIDSGQDTASDRSDAVGDALGDVSMVDAGVVDADGVDAPGDLQTDPGTADGTTCASTCSIFGEFRCSVAEAGISRQVEMCSLVSGCLRWLEAGTCATDEACCDGSCRSLASPSLCADTFDYYVDAAIGSDEVEAGSGLGGTRRNPFRTVSRAVREATIVGRTGMRIYIAPGVYDAERGESFPIVLRGGLSLYGAGSSLVTIRGTGDFSAPIGGGLAALEKVTIVAGDITQKTTISDITVRAEPDVATLYNIGVYCDRGSAPSTGAMVGVTSLENAVIGPGYDSAVTAFSSAAPAPSGCNLRMTGSRVTGAFNGVVANGCRSGASQRRQVAVQIGTAESGNVFTALNSDNSDSAGLLLQACVASGYIFSNTFQDSPEGIRIEQQSDPGVATHPFVINGNTFTRLSHVGLTVFGDAPVVDLNDNTFTLNSSPANANYGAAIGLWAYGNSVPGGYVPIRKARRNTFFANDVGVFLTSVYNVSTTEGGHLDFGTATDPGGNVFRCNSSDSHSGADLKLKMSSADAIPLHFAGNTWDHFPLATSPDGIFLDGTDYVFTYDLILATEGGRSEWTPCPPHHIPGPSPPPPDGGTD